MHAMNRAWQVKQTLPHNIAACSQAGGDELILLNYGSTDDLDDWVRANFMEAIKDGHLTYFHTKDPERFHASKSKNLSHRLATGDVVFNCDGDNYIEISDLHAIRQAFASGNDTFVWQFSGKQGDGTFGRIALRREHFQILGGYDEGLLPMSIQDDDIIIRSMMLGLRCIRLPPPNALPVKNTIQSKTPSGYAGSWSDMLGANLVYMESRQKTMGYRRENQFSTYRGTLNFAQEITVDGFYGLPQPVARNLPVSAVHPAAHPLRFNQALQKFRIAGKDAERLHWLTQMREAWGNTWSAAPELLMECCRSAAAARKAILECGTGLTSIVMSCVAGVPVYALEHDAKWARDLAYLKQRFDLSQLHVIHANLKSYGEFDWYDYSPPDGAVFDVVICDGPPGNTRGGRFGLLPVVGGCVDGGAVLLLDDMNRAEEQAIVRRWSDLHRIEGLVRNCQDGRAFGYYRVDPIPAE